jgi:hypothetical protein
MGRSTRYVSVTSCCEVTVRYNSLVGVPIFNIDKRPFAMLCAYNSSEHGRRYVSAAFQFHDGVALDADVSARRTRAVVFTCYRSVTPYTPKGISYDLQTGASLGVVILSAVLKRRMTLADKAKSLFISKCVTKFISRDIGTVLTARG